jgi:TolB-like protein
MIVGCTGNRSQTGQQGKAGSSSGPPRTVLAVLPFTGMWEKPGDAIGADWNENVHTMLTTTLPNSLIEAFLKKSSAGGFSVLSLDTARSRLEATKVAWDAEARQVLPDDVKAVLTGKLASDGKLTVQLVDAESGHLLWSKTYQLALDANLLQNRVNFGLLTKDHAELVDEVCGKLTSK